MQVIIKEPNCEPILKEVRHDLKTMQCIVGGLIEHISYPKLNGVDIWCNEEGKLLNLEPNIHMPEYQDDIVGTIFISACNIINGETISVPSKHIDFIMEDLKKRSI